LRLRESILPRDLFHWLSALIGVPAILYAGRVFFASAWGAVRQGRTNMDVPISIGVILATALSLYETATHGEHAWFDGTLMLLLFLLAGRALDAAMRDRARAGVDALLRQVASGATVMGRDGAVTWVAARDLVPGMVMRVPAGERLAADGEIVSGESRFDNSLLTGESAAVAAGPGGAVHAGTLNLEAPVDIRVTATGQLFACLGGAEQVDLRAALRSEAPDANLVAALDKAMRIKPERHHFHIERGAAPAQPRHMSLTGG